LSATASPDEMIELPPGPSTASTAFVLPAFAAVNRAVAAASGLLKACCACACGRTKSAATAETATALTQTIDT
jgi:hypothetical protein